MVLSFYLSTSDGSRYFWSNWRYRRLHDTGKSGWHQLWVITIIGIIPLIIWLCTEGSKEANKFGDPIDLSV